MKIVKAVDANNKEYIAYEGYSKIGTPVHIDKILADQYGDPKEMLAAEIAAYDEYEAGLH